mgnify:CR=1 FL=1
MADAVWVIMHCGRVDLMYCWFPEEIRSYNKFWIAIFLSLTIIIMQNANCCKSKKVAYGAGWRLRGRVWKRWRYFIFYYRGKLKCRKSSFYYRSLMYLVSKIRNCYQDISLHWMCEGAIHLLFYGIVGWRCWRIGFIGSHFISGVVF